MGGPPRRSDGRQTELEVVVDVALTFVPFFRGKEFKEDASTWNKNEDGKVVNGQPARVMDDRNGTGPTSGYIAKYADPLCSLRALYPQRECDLV